MFIAPVLVTIFMLAMAAFAQYGAYQQGDTLTQFAKQTMPKSMAAVKVSDLVVAAHLDLYRTGELGVEGQEEKKIGRERQAHHRESAACQERARQRWRANGRWSAKMRAQHAASTAKLAEYAKSAKSVLDIAATDASMGLRVPADGRKNLDNIKGGAGWAARYSGATDRSDGTAAFKADDQRRILFLVLLATALVLATVVTVTVARTISRPIAGMTRAMDRAGQRRSGRS